MLGIAHHPRQLVGVVEEDALTAWTGGGTTRVPHGIVKQNCRALSYADLSRPGQCVESRQFVCRRFSILSMAAWHEHQIALIRFVHAASVGRSHVEAFALGTRLTRLTRELATRDPDAALARVTGAVADWSGGTRLGDGLAEFNDQWGVRGMARGARVVILSDGWDRGDPSVLDEQMLRLGRVAHEVVWVNPLKATPGYAPLAQGMAAALPHIDQFVAGNSLDSLRVLAGLLAD